jgi:hypothetical protein
MITKEIASIISLIEGKFSPEEAAEIIETMVADRIRFHNIQMLRMWEGNHNFDSKHWDKKIEEMKADKNMAKQLIDEAKREGYKVEIVTNIEVRISKPVVRKLKLQAVRNMELSKN